MQIRIKEIRKQFGDTLQSLSEKIDYDYSNLSKVERGIYAPSLELLHKIASVYNIDITDLLILETSYNKKKIPLENTTISEGYLFSVDGQKLSEDEIDFLVQSIRIFRNKLNKYID
ncbi:transcriptional regulator [Bacillus thuringiensis]|uniref:helix-turn-helix domain-containing protein n=1 Tax=Bacillus thuringiensis TaxID=1428 RepID=UPI000BF57E4E|nr:helix-turn-helix transcriptional regulator [Bacillus thuringiensis]PEZ46195.1 transcriptional regulator [Bacillus thuringiensis]PGY51239.1 transcriptional regulator [Bacillus thuringiensis]